MYAKLVQDVINEFIKRNNFKLQGISNSNGDSNHPSQLFVFYDNQDNDLIFDIGTEYGDDILFKWEKDEFGNYKPIEVFRPNCKKEIASNMGNE